MNNKYENIAVSYLRRHGRCILARNMRLENIEIDILALRRYSPHEEQIELIEVKARSDTNLAYNPLSKLQIDRYRKFANLLYVRAGKYLDIQIKLLMIDKKNGLLTEVAI